MPPALEAQSLNPWSAKESPASVSLNHIRLLSLLNYDKATPRGDLSTSFSFI